MIRPIRIQLAKKDFRFAAAHMTVFSASNKEPLHGHEYRVSVDLDIDSGSSKAVIPFAEYKRPIRALCAQWDEKILLAERCSFTTVHSRNPLRFSVCEKTYELPSDEVLWLPIANVTCENLSEHFCSVYWTSIRNLVDSGVVLAAGVTIWESEGQGVTTWIRNAV